MKQMQGKAWKLGHDVDTDLIIAARYLNQSDPQHLAAHCLEDLIPQLPERVKEGDILVGGKNFGCGSSREHAPVAIKYAGFSCIIAESYARIFYRNAINIGLPVIVAPEAAQNIQEGAELAVDPVQGTIKDLTAGRSYQGQPFPPFMLEILEHEGVIPYLREKVVKNG